MKKSCVTPRAKRRTAGKADSAFARQAMAAMRRAQKAAGRESARFGLKLIVQEV